MLRIVIAVITLIIFFCAGLSLAAEERSYSGNISSVMAIVNSSTDMAKNNLQNQLPSPILPYFFDLNNAIMPDNPLKIITPEFQPITSNNIMDSQYRFQALCGTSDYSSSLADRLNLKGNDSYYLGSPAKAGFQLPEKSNIDISRLVSFYSFTPQDSEK